MSLSVMLRSTRLLKKACKVNPVAAYSSHAPAASPEKSLIGDREVVGFGFNGQPNYMDRVDSPFPAVRFFPPTAEIKALREKEKGDWKKLTMEEKKKLYRASFCQTFAELEAPTGEWKSIVGTGLFFISMALWIMMAMKVWVYPPLPETLSLERQQAQLQRMIDLAVNPIEGISSKWDYEKNDWKK